MKKTISKTLNLEMVNWRGFQPTPVIGVDEVGRGCLAGPVYAGAAILVDWKLISDENQKQEINNLESSLTDSKLLTPKKREELSEKINRVYRISLAWASEEEIEEFNIFQASMLAMKRAVQGLGVNKGHVLVDGKFKIPNLEGFVQTALIKGDLRAAPISAAAICAKVARDQKMLELAQSYPNYGLEKHKGYATQIHRDAIKKWGPTPIHRRSFEGVREYFL
jgi:ribonuclease HII